jgi:hypothetical protein
MRLTVDKLAQLTFYAVIGYLVLVHNRGAIGLARVGFGGWTGIIEALQGRSRPGR